MKNYGHATIFGMGVPKNRDAGLDWFIKASNAGDSDATNALGDFYAVSSYARHVGVAIDYKKAMKWYLKAAEQGNSHAMFSLSEMYRKGQGVERSQEKAEEWAEKYRNSR